MLYITFDRSHHTHFNMKYKEYLGNTWETIVGGYHLKLGLTLIKQEERGNGSMFRYRYRMLCKLILQTI